MASQAGGNKRLRNLGVLGGATLVVAGLAILALMQQARDLGGAFEPQPVFPGLTEQVNNLGEVTVESRDGTFHARRLEGGAWILPEKNDFPAAIPVVRATAVGMADLQAIAPRTAQPEFFERLGLVAPEDGGAAVRVVLSDREGNAMADLLIGNTEDIADPQGLSRIYVRRTGEDQTWLASGMLLARADINEWLDRTLFDLERDRVQSASFAPPEGPGFTVSRETVDEPNFALEDMPAGRELSYEGAANSAATALTGFTYDDAVPVDEIDFAGAPEAVFHTFDGLAVTAQIAEVEDAHWVRLSAVGGTGDTANEALAINETVGGWAFQVPAFNASSLTTERDSLLKPEG